MKYEFVLPGLKWMSMVLCATNIQLFLLMTLFELLLVPLCLADCMRLSMTMRRDIAISRIIIMIGTIIRRTDVEGSMSLCWWFL